ncbi:MAG: NAD(P)H-hydrate dehydratase [Acidobacteriota bacterium]|nr:NAD(P)H-hydrate dehydratase [Acidobacteriota bacterium]
MRILTAAEMDTVDRRSAEEFGISLETLMEGAGSRVAEFCTRHYPTASRVVVLCGKGNNGGDGLVAARMLSRAGKAVHVVLLGRADALQGQAAEALRKLREEVVGVALDEAVDEDSLRRCAPEVQRAELLVDAVVGTGFKPPLRGVAVAARDLVETLDTPVVAVDLPSGWDADSLEQKAEGAFRADAVVTFTAPKRAHVFGHLTRNERTGGTFGPVVVGQIGSPAAAVDSGSHLELSDLSWTGGAKMLAEKPRDVNSNKGLYGHVLVIGGSAGKAGAPAMASLACLRAGAGLVTAAVPRGIVDTVARIAPELMMVPLAEGSKGAVSFKNLDGAKLDALLKKVSVVALGPGLSTDGDAPEFARHVVEKTTLPVVIDADALNAFDGKTEMLHGTGRVMVLTPHPGEMARLAGMTVKQVEADRLGLARRFAIKHKVTLVLKGWRTLVAHPDGSVAVNTSGNPSMAKGGSGDILTGIVAAMLAQFPREVKRAVEAAVYLHGLAGDFAAHAMDEHTVLATDTVAHLSNAFRYRVTDRDGLVWVCGLRG